MTFSLANYLVSIYVGIIFVTFCGLYSPVLFHIIGPILSDTILAGAILNSSILKLAQSACIASVFPMLFDTFLDIFGNISMVNVFERLFLLLALLLPSVIFFIWNESSYMPFLYITLDMSKVIIIAAVIFISSSRTKFMIEKMSSFLFLPGMTFFCISRVLDIYSTIYPYSETLSLFSNLLFYLSVASILLSLIVWSYNLYHYSRQNGLHVDDYKSVIYMIRLLSYMVIIQLLQIFNDASTWEGSNGNLLASYLFAQVLFTTIATVLPGRLARQIVLACNETLALKSSFVRLVSHEIRSPLNVAYAGLEMLQNDLVAAKLTGTPIGDKTLVLAEDVYFSSEMAINVLNDFLLYENIDSGSFTLTLKRLPINNVFRDRLRPYFMISKKYNLTLTIEDTVSVSEFYNSNDGSNINCFDHLSSLYLNIDIHRIDQIIRNLVTNACKFTRSGGNIKIGFTFNAKDSPTVTDTDFVVGYLRVTVKDNGVGIAPEDHPKLFGQFVQFNSSELQGGGGM